MVAHEAGHQGAHSYRDIKWFDKVSIEMISLEKAKVGFSISPFIGKLSFEFDIIKILDPKYNVNLLS